MTALTAQLKQLGASHSNLADLAEGVIGAAVLLFPSIMKHILTFPPPFRSCLVRLS